MVTSHKGHSNIDATVNGTKRKPRLPDHLDITGRYLRNKECMDLILAFPNKTERPAFSYKAHVVESEALITHNISIALTSPAFVPTREFLEDIIVQSLPFSVLIYNRNIRASNF